MDTINTNENEIDAHSKSKIKIEKTDESDNFESKFEEYIIDALPNSFQEIKPNKSISDISKVVTSPYKKNTKIAVPTQNCKNSESVMTFFFLLI